MASTANANGFPPILSWKVASAVAICVILYGLAIALRNHSNHPLYRFPGPAAAAWSNFSYCYWFLGGRQPYRVLKLHNKYGPVVRTAPNELSFNTQGSWKDIYGFRQGHKPFIKSNFYDGGSFAAEAHSIVSEREPAEHGKMRKYLSHAFSDRSLKEQEYLIAEVVDQFINQIGKHGGDGLDLVMWFNLATFDIIGSLAFGEPFGGVASGTTHFWISIVISSLGQGALADCFNRFPILGKIFKLFASKSAFEDTARHEAYTTELVKKRINRKTDRKDFMVRLLENRDQHQISDVQLAAHASDFVVAGSETTATTLSCISYYLLRTPRVLVKLQEEVRDAFSSYDEINAISTIPLSYLQAVALEGMRIYPPLPLGLPRVVPAGGDTVDGYFLPGGTIVSTNPIAASQSPANFENPLEFKPERWLGPNEKDILEASQPFSLGARGCLGRSLAWMELRTILAKLHFNYDLKLLNVDLDWQRDSEMHTLWKKPQLIVKVMPRRN